MSTKDEGGDLMFRLIDEFFVVTGWGPLDWITKACIIIILVGYSYLKAFGTPTARYRKSEDGKEATMYKL